MRRFDFKSAAAGFLVGAAVISAAFAAGGIQSATASQAKVVLDGVQVRLKNPLVSVVMEGEKNASLYMPVRELLEYAGYTVTWNGAEQTVELTSAQKTADSGTVFTLTNQNGNQMAASGSFQAAEGQTLKLKITSDIKGGTVDFFLFDPSGKEQRITIGSEDRTKEISLSGGTWAYNCSGKFHSGSLKIVGTIVSK